MLNKTNSSEAFHFMLEIQIQNFHFVGIFFFLNFGTAGFGQLI